jgi:hypothetical protein
MAIQSLFGLTPAQITEQRRKEAEQSILQQGSEFGIFAPFYQAGLRSQQRGREALAPILGTQDPMLQQATAVQSVLAKYQGQDLSSPEVLNKIGQDLLQVAPDAGMRAMAFARELSPQKAKPIAVSQGQQLVDPSTGQVVYTAPDRPEKPTAKYRTLSSAEARARGLDPNNVYQIEEGTEKVSPIGQGPAVVFNAPLVGAEKSYASDVGKARATRDVAQFGAAEAATENLSKIYETLDELKTGQAFTGAFADIQTNVQKVQAKFAADKKAGKRVSDTEYLDALLGSDVFPMIGALGIGARGLDTPAERDFLRQVMTGTIKLERDTLVRLTELRKNIAERAIDKFNQRVDKGELDDFFKYQGTKRQKFEKPRPPEKPKVPGSAPAGIDPRIWNVMTPEEKALWNK